MLALDGSGMLGAPIWTEGEGWMDGFGVNTLVWVMRTNAGGDDGGEDDGGKRAGQCPRKRVINMMARGNKHRAHQPLSEKGGDRNTYGSHGSLVESRGRRWRHRRTMYRKMTCSLVRFTSGGWLVRLVDTCMQDGAEAGRVYTAGAAPDGPAVADAPAEAGAGAVVAVVPAAGAGCCCA